MRTIHKRGWCGLLLGLTLAGAGCTRGDRERLGRVGRKIGEKATVVRESAGSRLHSGWQRLRVNLDAGGLSTRVSTRLRSDKELVNTSIQVEAKGTEVTLKGAVANLSQRQRAVALAESTVGVETVVDRLQMPPSE
jgi:osmotically-inducible protein OsmY